MKKLHTILFLFISLFAYSQNNGINFQGVGRNSSGAVLATQKISLRFTVIQGSETGSVEYVESKEVTTNAQGIFSVVIGDGTQISKTGNFTDINWKINPKFLKVEMDPAGGSSFAAMGTTRLQSVPFAYYANGVNAENVDGVLSASKGGTGVASISALKTALGVDQLNNTSDLAKPISTATQTALDTKVSTTSFSTTLATKANVADVALKANASDVALKAPLESPTFTGTVSGITKTMVGLSNVENTADLAKPISTATQTALDTKVSTATFSTTMATKANVADVALKAPLESPTFTGTVLGITKAMVGLSNVENTADLAKQISTATQAALDTKVSTATFSTTVAAKANLTDVALKAPIESPTFTGTVSGITKVMVGLSNVENTADLAKPISTATQTALDNKLDISTAEAAFARVDQSNLFRRDQAIEGGLTANRINFPGLYNSYIEGFPIPQSDIEGLNINNDYFVSVGKTLVDNTKGWLFDIRNNKLVLPNGTQIESGNASETVFQLKPDTDFTIRTSIDGYNRSLQFDKEGYLRFSDGGRINDAEDRFEFKADDKQFEINIFNSDMEHSYSWKFSQWGVLELPGGALFGNYYSPGFNIFELNTPNGISLKTDEEADTRRGASVNISPYTNQGKIQLQTREFNQIQDALITQTWEFDSQSKMHFPDGTTLASSFLSSNFFELKTGDNDGFKITNSDDPDNPKTWTFGLDGNMIFPGGDYIENDTYRFGITTENKRFQVGISDSPNMSAFYWTFGVDGKLEFPDGSKFGAPEGEGTTGFIASNNTSFLIETNSTSNNSTTFNAWDFNKDGALVFPDGTISSGTISGTSNFGFDTRATENGFSILTGTSTGTAQLWTFDTNGVLNLPAGGDIKIGGNSVLSGNLKFFSEEFAIAGGSQIGDDLIGTNPNVYSDGTLSIIIPLTHTPISYNHISVTINNERVSKNLFALVGNQLYFNKVNFGDFSLARYSFFIDYHY